MGTVWSERQFAHLAGLTEDRWAGLGVTRGVSAVRMCLGGSSCGGDPIPVYGTEVVVGDYAAQSLIYIPPGIPMPQQLRSRCVSGSPKPSNPETLMPISKMAKGSCMRQGTGDTPPLMILPVTSIMPPGSPRERARPRESNQTL
ncbi:unnamed protein product [Arctogadus glacialis]